jgi:predicted enzyme related to lactoylglutathione lyase
MHGEPAFFEIGVPDDGRARTFYGKLFQWRFPPFGDAGQVSIETPTMRGGLHGQDPECRIGIYFDVADLDAAVRLVRELGGQAEDAGPEEPGFGRFACCRDDQGVSFGLHQEAR